MILLSISTSILLSCSSSKEADNADSEITIENRAAEKHVDILVDGKLFTSYVWPDSVMKPVLYPIINSNGTEVTRGFPLKPRPGERTDHPHHVGMWLNYGNVNGYDFWGNSFDIPEDTRNKTGGWIRHVRIGESQGGKNNAKLETFSSWQDPTGKQLLEEKTEFYIITQGSIRIIDRVTTLTATNGDVSFKDTKEGMFAIRVNRGLELPSNEEVTLTDAAGNPTTVKKLSNEGVTGNYESSEGIRGDSVWGTKAKWMDLYGYIGDEKVSLVIVDHPKNPGYPTYWHARGYGLFSANPFGAFDFTKGKETMNFSIANGKSATIRYRVIVSANEHLTNEQINNLADDFSKKY
ncbi:MAG: PmoA family protein [Chitinophagaceae bacterium]|nr:PmoA family protein [Chitinophagaceae bacterium]